MVLMMVPRASSGSSGRFRSESPSAWGRIDPVHAQRRRQERINTHALARAKNPKAPFGIWGEYIRVSCRSHEEVRKFYSDHPLANTIEGVVVPVVPRSHSFTNPSKPNGPDYSTEKLVPPPGSPDDFEYQYHQSQIDHAIQFSSNFPNVLEESNQPPEVDPLPRVVISTTNESKESAVDSPPRVLRSGTVIHGSGAVDMARARLRRETYVSTPSGLIPRSQVAHSYIPAPTSAGDIANGPTNDDDPEDDWIEQAMANREPPAEPNTGRICTRKRPPTRLKRPADFNSDPNLFEGHNPGSDDEDSAPVLIVLPNQREPTETYAPFSAHVMRSTPSPVFQLPITRFLPHVDLPIGEEEVHFKLQVAVDTCAGLNIGSLRYHAAIYDIYPDSVEKFVDVRDADHPIRIGGVDAEGSGVLITHVITYKLPTTYRGHGARISFGLSDNVSCTTLIGVGALRNSEAIIDMTSGTPELNLQNLNLTLPITFKAPFLKSPPTREDVLAYYATRDSA